MREKIVIDYANKDLRKEDVFHSSGYAQAQSGDGLGAAGGEGASFAARQAIEEQRKYIQGYRNAKIVNSFYGLQRAKAWKPKSAGSGEMASAGGTAGTGRYSTEGGRYASEGDGGHTASKAYNEDLGRNRRSVGSPVDGSMTRARAIASGPKSAMRAPISLRGR